MTIIMNNAEVLVPHCIPYDYVVCATVVNETAAGRLRATKFDRDIIVEPRVFFKRGVLV